MPYNNGNRAIHEIASEIEKSWPKVYFGARPYLDAMKSLNVIGDNYGDDSGSSVVAYFLANAQGWRGDVARRIKAELNAMLKGDRR